jgi:hypothetical protein
VGYSVTDRSRAAGSIVWVEYRRAAGSGTDGEQTAAVQIPAGGSATTSVPLSGLEPGAEYRYRAVATSASGFVYGPEKSFTTIPPPASGPPPPAPDDATVILQPFLNSVAVRLRELDRFYALPAIAKVPLRSEVDATRGLLDVSMGGSAGRGTITAGGGVFLVRGQVRGVADFQLTKKLRCGKRKKSHGGADTDRLQVVYRRGSRRISVTGLFASAVPSSSSTFSVAELCQGTRVSVTSGAVLVKGRKGQPIKTVRAGHSYLRRGNR